MAEVLQSLPPSPLSRVCFRIFSFLALPLNDAVVRPIRMMKYRRRLSGVHLHSMLLVTLSRMTRSVATISCMLVSTQRSCSHQNKLDQQAHLDHLANSVVRVMKAWHLMKK